MRKRERSLIADIVRPVLAVAFIALCSCLAERPAVAQGWSNGYALRRTITVDHTKVPNTDQVNFPVLVSATYPDIATVANGGNVTNANGFDIIFTSDANGSTVLPFEQELYNASTGNFIYWVQIPTVSHTTDTVFYLFYGNPSINTDQSNKTGVWDSNYQGVWHLANGTTLSGADSTSHAYNLTNNNSSAAAAGQIDGAASFNGTNNYLSNSQLAITAGSSITVSFWNYVTSANVQSAFAFTIGGSDTPNRISVSAPWSDKNLYWDYGTYTSGRVSQSYTNYLGQWTYATVEYNSSNTTHSLYLNGALATSDVNSNVPQTTQTGIEIGAWQSLGCYHHGIIDEFRVSTVARSADWIAAEYNNQNSPAAFISVGSAASGPNSVMIATLSPRTAHFGDLVTIQGANFGTTQGGSTVTFNGSLVTPQSWSSTAISVYVPTNTISGPFYVTVNSTTAVSPVLMILMPAGWLDSDVGSVGLAGTASYAYGTFTVTGGGASIYGTADGFHYAYQTLNGDGTIVARVISVSGSQYPQAGVMIRETLNANSTHAYTCYEPYPSTDAYFYWRPSTGASTSSANASITSLPYWVKVVRSGSSFSSYIAPDGVNWTQVGSTQTISMAQNVYIGLAVSANNNSVTATAAFDNVSVSPTASPAPAITGVSPATAAVGAQATISGSNFGASQNGSVVTLNGLPVTINSWSSTSITIAVPSGATSGNLVISVAPSMDDSNPVAFYVDSMPGSWLDQDIGEVGIVGSAGYANGTFTLNGGGTTGGTADGFHFAYQSLSGDGTIVARVVRFNADTGSAGVMIRETLTPGSTNAYVAFTPDHNWFAFYDRTSTGGSANQVGGEVSGTPPYWLKLVRSGSTFTGYSAPDGVNWTAFQSATISMATNVYIGLAVDSENWTPANATFDNVSINSSSAPAPVINSVSESKGWIGSQIVIFGSNFGASQGNSLVMLNATPMTVNSWSNTSITVTVSGGSSGILVVSIAPNMNDSNPIQFTLIQQGQIQQTPSGWTDKDINAGGGSATYEGGTFTVNGAGQGVGSTSDGFNFEYQSLSGDGTIIARLVGAAGGSTNQSIGVMIRNDLSAGSINVYTFLGGGNSEVYFTDRTSSGGSTTTIGNTSAVSFPYWVKLVRSSSTFSAYSSPDGVNWTQIGSSQTITMSQNVYIGLAVSSVNTSLFTTATFDNVSLSPPTATTSAFTGTVTKAADGTAISGAQIQALQQGVVIATTSSSSSGSYTLSGLPAGTYDVQFSASGFGTLSDSGVFAAAGMTETLNASLSLPGSISGTVTQSDGVTPISGAAVQASVGSAVASSTTTNSSGNYTISGLNEGSYVVQASGSGYVTTTQSASVTANSTSTVNISLLTRGSGASSYVYDPLGRLVAVILQSGGAVVYNYDAVGNLLSIVSQNSSQLSILGFAPSRGPVGSTVTIYGTAFSTTPSQNTVKFNGTAATVQSATSTQLVVTVPTGATTGAISVTVSGNTVTSSNSFTVGNP